MVTNLVPGSGDPYDPEWITDPERPYGSFSGAVEATWEADGRHMRLLKPLIYTDGAGVVWEAPKGSCVDGASVPRILWTLVGSPFTGKYRDASVIHDVACVARTRPWKVTHRAFLSAMRASGVEVRQARKMYMGVYHFGPRWPSLEMRNVQTINGTETIAVEVPPLPQTLTEPDVLELAAIIDAEANDPAIPIMSLEEIENFVSKRRPTRD
ncbi:MAG TPA: DUF1353 domain-containing protein [Vicinamibacterales bacterium]|nr:DUF1353 domain-containing protein [Vicinamibacterales bacterium]